MDPLLDTVIVVLKSDESAGCEGLESLVELTEAHGEIWRGCFGKLVYVVSETMKT